MSVLGDGCGWQLSPAGWAPLEPLENSLWHLPVTFHAMSPEHTPGNRALGPYSTGIPWAGVSRAGHMVGFWGAVGFVGVASSAGSLSIVLPHLSLQTTASTGSL